MKIDQAVSVTYLWLGALLGCGLTASTWAAPHPAPAPARADTTPQVQVQAQKPDWPFFAFCAEVADAQKRTIPQQTELLKELGYDGYGHLWLDGAEERAQSLAGAGLRLIQLYIRIDLSQPEPVEWARLTALLPKLQPHRTQLALLITGGKPSDPALDERALVLLRRLADQVKPLGLSCVLYPHVNDWLEKVSDGVRLAKQLDRPNEVGVMFNLCHWMKGDPQRDLRGALREAAPWLKAVSLSGSDRPEDVRANRGNWIQPLGQGTYDVRELLGILTAIRFQGPIGLQCYGLGGDARDHLTASMRTWKRYQAEK